MNNLAKEFAKITARKCIENCTPEQFEALKKWALLLFDQNVWLLQDKQDSMLKELLSERE